jgi:hypothetical protein
MFTCLIFDAKGHNVFGVLHNPLQGMYMNCSKVEEILGQAINNKRRIWSSVDDHMHEVANHLKIWITLNSHVVFFSSRAIYLFKCTPTNNWVPIKLLIKIQNSCNLII